jgi:hypothetical protein
MVEGLHWYAGPSALYIRLFLENGVGTKSQHHCYDNQPGGKGKSKLHFIVNCYTVI